MIGRLDDIAAVRWAIIAVIKTDDVGIHCVYYPGVFKHPKTTSRVVKKLVEIISSVRFVERATWRTNESTRFKATLGSVESNLGSLRLDQSSIVRHMVCICKLVEPAASSGYRLPHQRLYDACVPH